MRKYLLLLSIFILSFSANDVQSEFIVLDWNKMPSLYRAGNNTYSYSFDGAVFSPGKNGMPCFSKIYDLSTGQSGFKFVIEDLRFDEVENELDTVVFSSLPLEVSLESQVLKSGGAYKTEVQVFPFKRSGGKLFRLASFNLKKIPVKLNKSAVSSSTQEWKSVSVLNTGTWLKVKTSGKGVYKIPYSTLSEWGFSEPSKVSVYGSGGIRLSEKPGEITYDDLEQNAVWHDENNGENCLFFYEPGNICWEPDGDGEYFQHSNHYYSNNGYFFLSEDAGSTKIVEKMDQVGGVATSQLTEFDAYDVYEKDVNNLISSGKNWYGEKLSYSSSKSVGFGLKELGSSKKIHLKISALARSYQSSSMYVYANSELLGTLSFSSVNTESNEGAYASGKSAELSYSAGSTDLEVGWAYRGSNSNAIAWLDYIEINYRGKLTVGNGELFFRDLSSVGEGNIVEFQVESSSSSLRVFDVTDMNDVTEIPVDVSGDTHTFKRPADELREYLAFDPSGTFSEPGLVGEVENQNLHGLSSPEFLIVAHPSFLDAANDLAQFHESYDGLSTEVVSSIQVYNEFSSGHFGAVGIRNFIKMFYDRGNTLKYVLLFGDGSFDNKNIQSGDLNFIPTFQSDNSLTPVSSFITDDFYVILDEGETVYSGAIDLGIGRIPASTVYQARTVVDKIENYRSSAALGNWRNILCFVGDDEDSNLHMTQSENLADMVNENHPEYVTKKIYLDAYAQETTTSGEEYPGANEAIKQDIGEGVLIFNYVGHANKKHLAEENVLDISGINSLSNFNTLPIFVTATCEFSRFDYDEMSAGEHILFNANGGGIGLFSTTRVVISDQNYLLSRSFYNHVFERGENDEPYRLGDVMRLAKINISNSTNKRNFSLLADPALRLSYPKYEVVTSTINNQDATSAPDTIGALQKITVSGYVADYEGKKIEGFTGQIIPTVYDKAIETETLGNAGGTPMKFEVQENVLYKGVASVDNGEFSFSFVVPKDISYNLGNGKIIYYADNGDTDANGVFENFIIGGTDNQIADSQGPDIKMYMDSKDFVPGGKTSTSPTLLAYLSDENGINTTGTGIGHDITAVLDGDYSNVYVLNDYYQSDIDDYTSGALEYQLAGLSAGAHTLTLRAWDVANNSSEAEIQFVVSGELQITGVSNYPNPMQNYTYFVFGHNQSGATFDVLIEVFDIEGRRIDYFTSEVSSNGLESTPVYWDLNELKLDAGNGVYVYRVTIQNEEGARDSKSGKIIISY